MKLAFSSKQIQLLNKLDIPFDFMGDLTDDEICALDEIVINYFEYYCILANDEISEEGVIRECIIHLIVDSE